MTTLLDQADQILPVRGNTPWEIAGFAGAAEGEGVDFHKVSNPPHTAGLAFRSGVGFGLGGFRDQANPIRHGDEVPQPSYKNPDGTRGRGRNV